MERGDIYLVFPDPIGGHEEQAGQPVLVISPIEFNALTKTPVVVPIMSVGKGTRNAGFTVQLTGVETQTTGIVRCDLPRVLDFQARHGRKLESLPAYLVEEVLAKLVTLFE